MMRSRQKRQASQQKLTGRQIGGQVRNYRNYLRDKVTGVLTFKHLQFLALWMSFLIITIPFVEANTLNVVSISGKDNLNGLRRSQDTLHVQVQATVTEGDVTNLTNLEQNVIIAEAGSYGGISFDKCVVSSGSTYLCDFIFPKGDTDRKTKRTAYTIDLFPDQPESVSTSALLDVDNAGPTVPSVAVDKNIVTGGVVQLSFAVQDKSCSGCARCAGVKRADLYANGTKVATAAVESDDCLSVSETMSFDTTSAANGIVTLCIVPSDHFDQTDSRYLSSGKPVVGNNCVKVTKDATQPAGSDVHLTYANTEEDVQYLSDAGTQVTLAAHVTVGQFGLKSVTFDLTPFGSAPLFADCSKADSLNEYLCTKTFFARLNADKTVTVKQTIVDNAGNTVEQSSSFALKIDTDVPSVVFLGTAVQLDNDSILGKQDNTLVATITDKGSGIDSASVHFIIEGENLQATYTGESCKYSPYEFSGAATSTMLRVEGMDKVGHPFTSEKSITVDAAPPQLLNYTIRNNRKTLYFQQGDTILLSATILDATSLSIDASTADFNSFSNNSVNNPECTPVNTPKIGARNIYSCVWTIFDAAPSTSMKARLTLTDAVKNAYTANLDQFSVVYTDSKGAEQISSKKSQSVAAVANATANFWELKIENPSPSFVDDDTTRVTSYRVFWPAKMSSRGSGGEIVQLNFNKGMCSGNGTKYLDTVELLQPDPNTFDAFYFKTTFKKGPVDTTSVTFTCAVETTTIFGNTVYPSEFDNQTFTIPVVNVGEISQGVKDNIEKVRNSWLVKASWIGTINKFLQFAKSLCGFIQAAVRLLGVLISVIFGTEALDDFGITYPIGLGVRTSGESTSITLGTVYKTVTKFCKYLSCRTGWLGTMKYWNDKKDNAATNPIFHTDPKYLEATAFPSDPSQSLILSIASLCVPGVFYNLQKARSIECTYLDCLHNKVPGGTPPFMCDRLRNYGWCRYVFGEIFQIIPFANFIQDIVGTISRLLSNPISLTLGIVQFSCNSAIAKAVPHGICSTARYVVLLGDTMQDISTIRNMNWKLSSDNCKPILAQLKEEEGGQSSSTNDTNNPDTVNQ